MAEINKIIKNARDVLVGKVPDPQSQIDQITLALIYKFMDAKDREARSYDLPATFFVGEYEDYSFTRIMKATSNPEKYKLYSTGIELLQNRTDLPSTFVSVFKDAFIPYRDPQTLNLFLAEIDKIPTDNTELLGTAFEDLLSIMGSQGDAGQFRTPRHIIDMIVEIVNPQKGETILDPACGTAGFLISAYNKISKTDLSVEEREHLMNNGLVGYDINPNMVKLANVNLFLHNCKKPNIHLYDTLSEKTNWKDDYDVILANPPFMTPKGGIRPHELFNAINANRSEVLFTYYIAKHLKRDGRAGVIVPEGVVFQSANAYKNLRRMLIEENYLYAVISLPSGVFNPYSGVKTSILLMDRALARKTDKILFVKMNNDGFDLGAQRRMIEKNDIPNIISLVKEYISCVETESVDTFSDKYGLSVLASKEEIAENDYVLVGDRYKNNLPLDCEYEMVQLGDTRYFCLESGGTPNSNNAEYWDGDINWVTLVDLPDTDRVTLIKETGRKITSLGLKNSSAKLLPANSILVSSRATIGRVAISKVELATNQGFKNIVIKDFSKVDPYYIALMLSAQQDKLSNMATGGTFKEFSKRALENFQIPLPPIEIQKQIVAEIESYQKIIDGAKLVVGNYKPTYSCGGINCEKKTIKDVVVFNPAKTEVKDFVGDVSFVPMSEVQEHSIHFECKGTKKINEVYIGYTYFRESDVLIAKVTPCFENGKSGIARNLTNGIGFGSSEFFVLRAYNEIILPELIYCVISSNEFISQGKEHMTGTGGLKRLNKDFVLNYPIFVPPMEEQKLIVQRIQQEYEIVEANKKLISIFEQKIKDKLSEVWGE